MRVPFRSLVAQVGSALAAVGSLAWAAPAGAASFWALVSFDGVPPVAVGSADLVIDFDPGEMTPVFAGELFSTTEILPVRCTGPPLAPCATAIGAGPDLAAANAVSNTQILVGVLALDGLAAAGDLVAIPFDVQDGATPAATLTVTGMTGATAVALVPAQQPSVSLRFAVPEPGGATGAAAALLTILALKRRSVRGVTR
ncbi:MAG: hypothetical protein M5U32_11650 [Myxococcota bacterium]|nr:hypothetical protein [Myxococcota bacterium]